MPPLAAAQPATLLRRFPQESAQPTTPVIIIDSTKSSQPSTEMTVAASLIFLGTVFLLFAGIAAVTALCHGSRKRRKSLSSPNLSTRLSKHLQRRYSSSSVYTSYTVNGTSSAPSPGLHAVHAAALSAGSSSSSLALLSAPSPQHLPSYGSVLSPTSRKNSFSNISSTITATPLSLQQPSSPATIVSPNTNTSTSTVSNSLLRMGSSFLKRSSQSSSPTVVSLDPPPSSSSFSSSSRVPTWSPFEFSSVGYGIFSQDDPTTNDSKFSYLKSDFGLVLHGGWPALDLKLRQLQEDADRVFRNSGGTVQSKYKLLFVARHGQGYHNLAIEIYGQAAWDSYWSMLDGDGNLVWGPDPDLTPLGVEQAKRNNIAWKRQIATKNAPVPKAFFASPFARATDTMMYTWADISSSDSTNPTNNYYTGKKSASNISIYALDSNCSATSTPTVFAATASTSPSSSLASPKKLILDSGSASPPPQEAPPDKTSLSRRALIVEDLRETIGVHTCDMRSPQSAVAARHPDVRFEPGFSEKDVLWTADHRETPDEQNVRVHRFLDKLFAASNAYSGALLNQNSAAESPDDEDPDLDAVRYVSITAHSGTINSLLKVTGHRPFNVPPGGMIPVVIKATRYLRLPVDPIDLAT
ncbi:uncharacterized protein SAPINGB_P004632 [Magnusiomyces paraingens]|uniref:Phosphoglycerate mutase n=1 Tax=Magnusiomyces paraingens TaxID=2606893 RepID=A0A5E8BXZ8_9ASCO|nr:uncharacterized protein SAPINGB_P004632 [Saprochaete ingens]VVT55509.1 unnamed protein product [Saprochaete ingens]